MYRNGAMHVSHLGRKIPGCASLHPGYATVERRGDAEEPDCVTSVGAVEEVHSPGGKERVHAL
jgi:hypothetical protein